MFAIRGLAPTDFAPLFELSDDDLRARGARRRIANSKPGFPCRVSLDDADVGDELVLVHYEHHAVDTPYRGSGPVFAKRGATRFDAVDVVPPALLRRMLSVRAYDAHGMMRDADLCDGPALADHIARVFRDERVAYLHVHLAKPGCFACRVDRVV